MFPIMSFRGESNRRPGGGADPTGPCFLLPPLGHGQGEARSSATAEIEPGHMANPILRDSKTRAKERRDENKRKKCGGERWMTTQTHFQVFKCM